MGAGWAGCRNTRRCYGGTRAVWAEPSEATPQPITCGARPSFVNECQYLKSSPFNEAASGQAPFFNYVVTEVAGRYAVGSADLPTSATFGFIDLENRVEVGCLFEPVEDRPLQLFVMPLSSAQGRFSVGFNAHRMGDELCPTPAL